MLVKQQARYTKITSQQANRLQYLEQKCREMNMNYEIRLVTYLTCGLVEKCRKQRNYAHVTIRVTDVKM